MAETGRWNGHIFTVSPSLIRSFTGLQIKASSKTEDKENGGEGYVARKNGNPSEVSFTVKLNTFTGCDVRYEAITLAQDAQAGKSDYFYVGNKKLLAYKLMLTEATVRDIEIASNGTWVQADVLLTMKQCTKSDGSVVAAPAATSSGGSSSKKSSSSKSTSKKASVKKSTTTKKTEPSPDAWTRLTQSQLNQAKKELEQRKAASSVNTAKKTSSSSTPTNRGSANRKSTSSGTKKSTSSSTVKQAASSAKKTTTTAKKATATKKTTTPTNRGSANRKSTSSSSSAKKKTTTTAKRGSANRK